MLPANNYIDTISITIFESAIMSDIAYPNNPLAIIGTRARQSSLESDTGSMVDTYEWHIASQSQAAENASKKLIRQWKILTTVCLLIGEILAAIFSYGDVDVDCDAVIFYSAINITCALALIYYMYMAYRCMNLRSEIVHVSWGQFTSDVVFASVGAVTLIVFLTGLLSKLIAAMMV